MCGVICHIQGVSSIIASMSIVKWIVRVIMVVVLHGFQLSLLCEIILNIVTIVFFLLQVPPAFSLKGVRL